MESWVELVENNTGSSELDADEFNFGAMPTEQASTKIPTEASPPLKIGNKNKKRTRNFSEKEDILLASAWLEVSMDPVQSIDQTRSSYWQRIHECYHKHKTFESDRNISYLSHTVGVSFKEVLVNFVHGTVKYFVQIKAVSPSKTGYEVLYFD